MIAFGIIGSYIEDSWDSYAEQVVSFCKVNITTFKNIVQVINEEFLEELSVNEMNSRVGSNLKNSLKIIKKGGVFVKGIKYSKADFDAKLSSAKESLNRISFGIKVLDPLENSEKQKAFRNGVIYNFIKIWLLTLEFSELESFNLYQDELIYIRELGYEAISFYYLDECEEKGISFCKTNIALLQTIVSTVAKEEYLVEVM